MKKERIKLQLFSSVNQPKKYYSLHQQENTADIYIYGDITSYPWFEGDTSSYNLSQELQALDDVDNINIYLNSYGGEVAEGLAIYNSLKRHKAKITTIVDGFACSIASVIFAAGDERIMSDTSLLMIHNAWQYSAGNANELRKQADDLEKVTQASVNAYMSTVNIEENDLKELLDNETWLSSSEAIEMGFATKLVEDKDNKVASQSIRRSLMQMVKQDNKPTKKTIATVNVSLESEEFKKVLQQEINKLKAETVPPEEPTPKQNKPLSMVKALFKTKGEC